VTDFKRLLRALADLGVDFVLVGGVAATVHGSARLTLDIDVVYRRSRENIERLVRALMPYHPYLRGAPPGLPFRWEAATVERGLNFTLTTDIGDLDLLGEIVGGGTYETLLPHTIAIQVFGVECRCLDLPALIRVKRAAGRPKDLEAVAELEAILEERLRAEGQDASDPR
jgi:predicted nucleotidyltransferase